MDWLTFVSRLVDALAWPTAVVLIIFILRKPLSTIIESLQSLTFKGAAANFAHHVQESVAKVKEQADRAGIPDVVATHSDAAVSSEFDWDKEAPAPAHGGSPAFHGELLGSRVNDLATRPTDIVMRGWLDVDRALTDALMRLGVLEAGADIPPQGHRIRMLAESGAIDTVTVGIVTRLASLRNTLMHSFFVSSTAGNSSDDTANVTYDSAKAYRDIALRVAGLLDSIAAK
jgi:hypothetical protein